MKRKHSPKNFSKMRRRYKSERVSLEEYNECQKCENLLSLRLFFFFFSFFCFFQPKKCWLFLCLYAHKIQITNRYTVFELNTGLTSVLGIHSSKRISLWFPYFARITAKNICEECVPLRDANAFEQRVTAQSWGPTCAVLLSARTGLAWAHWRLA